jgi:hypothetical protein
MVGISGTSSQSVVRRMTMDGHLSMLEKLTVFQRELYLR